MQTLRVGVRVWVRVWVWVRVRFRSGMAPRLQM